MYRLGFAHVCIGGLDRLRFFLNEIPHSGAGFGAYPFGLAKLDGGHFARSRGFLAARLGNAGTFAKLFHRGHQLLRIAKVGVEGFECRARRGEGAFAEARADLGRFLFAG